MSPIMRECLETGCATLIPRTEERCDVHKGAQHARDDARRLELEPWRPFYTSPRWRGTAGRAKRRDGFSCRRMFGDLRCNSTDGLSVHHKRRVRTVYEQALRDGASKTAALAIVEAMFFDLNEVVTLCASCHNEADAEQREEART